MYSKNITLEIFRRYNYYPRKQNYMYIHTHETIVPYLTTKNTVQKDTEKATILTSGGEAIASISIGGRRMPR